MPVDAAIQQYVSRRLARLGLGQAINALRTELTNVFLNHLPRHDEFTLTNVAVGTVEQATSWLVPITSDYTVLVAPVTGTTPAGLVTATLKAGTKTPTGCTLIVANRSAATVAAATFDVLAFPI